MAKWEEWGRVVEEGRKKERIKDIGFQGEKTKRRHTRDQKIDSCWVILRVITGRRVSAVHPKKGCPSKQYWLRMESAVVNAVMFSCGRKVQASVIVSRNISVAAVEWQAKYLPFSQTPLKEDQCSIDMTGWRRTIACTSCRWVEWRNSCKSYGVNGREEKVTRQLK